MKSKMKWAWQPQRNTVTLQRGENSDLDHCTTHHKGTCFLSVEAAISVQRSEPFCKRVCQVSAHLLSECRVGGAEGQGRGGGKRYHLANYSFEQGLVRLLKVG